MIRVSVSFLFALLWVTLVSAQLTVDAKEANQLFGIENAQQHGDAIFVAEDTTVTIKPVILVSVTTEAANISFEVSDKDRLPVPFEQLDKNLIVVSKPGKSWVDITVIDFANNLYGRRLVLVEVKGKVPIPPDDDVPNPPDDDDPEIGNEYGLGLIAYKNAPKKNPKQVAALYRAAADMLYGRPRAMTVDQTLEWLDTEVAKISLQGDPEGWKVWLATLDLALLESQRKKPSGYSRQDWYGAYYEIAKALEVVK